MGLAILVLISYVVYFFYILMRTEKGILVFCIQERRAP